MPHHTHDDKETLFLVHQYEEMLRKDAVAFFEQPSFDRLLDYYEKYHKLDLALNVIDYALEQHPYSVQFYIRKTQILLEKNEIEEALVILDQAETLDASELEIYLLRAEALSIQGKSEQALQILDDARAVVSSDELDEIYLGEANVFEDMELFDKSFEALENALGVNPKNRAALERIWLLVELSGKYKESVHLHKAVLDAEPYSHQAWYNLGHAYFCLDQFENAVEAYEFAIAIDEKFEFAYRDCAEALYRSGLFEKAIECYLDALEHIKPDADLYTNLGLCYEQLELFSKAKEYYFMALKFDPQSDITFYRIGECYSKEDNWVRAINAYNKAIKLNGQNPDYLASIAEAYVEVEDFKQAEEMFRAATEMAPEESEKWVQYSSFLLFIDIPERALEVIEEAHVYCASAALDYCECATLVAMGYRKAAFQALQSALTEDFELYPVLFDLDPELVNDAEINNFIQLFAKDRPQKGSTDSADQNK